MFDEWILLLAVTVLLVIQTLRAIVNRRAIRIALEQIDILNRLIIENATATKEMNDLLLEKMPHLKAEVEAEMEQWRKGGGLK
ncbi:MAG TPA: hypothetical protein VIR02_12955 [Anaerolineales bacterium]